MMMIITDGKLNDINNFNKAILPQPQTAVRETQHPNATPRQPSAMRAGSFWHAQGLANAAAAAAWERIEGTEEGEIVGWLRGGSQPTDGVRDPGAPCALCEPASRRKTFPGEVRPIAVLCTRCRCMLVSVSVVVCLRRG